MFIWRDFNGKTMIFKQISDIIKILWNSIPVAKMMELSFYSLRLLHVGNFMDQIGNA